MEEGREGIACHLLCAVPQLLDPNFHRSVVFMIEHNEEGALGLVVNNPTPTPIAQVAESVGLQWEGGEEEPVRVGGPVQPARGWILHDLEAWDPSAANIAPGLMLTTSLQPVLDADHAAFGGDRQSVLFMLGFAGWGPGQLESEIAAGSWVLVPVRESEEVGTGVSIRWLFETDPGEMWTGALGAIGVDPIRLVGLQGGGEHLH